MSQPKQIDSPLYMLLRKDDVEGFNQEKPRTGTIDMAGGDFRGLDLRHTPMEGASIAHAQISGVFFPAELSADEILMSVNFGTRLRYRTR
ncbi:hypothetical protein [Pseudomonas syringae]|uniref:hypothetical protein n=1 Tax=Pseudomonas syringae TaxID=317 RepID=UPI0007106BD4|nr:hypothetical protein [Pseudomonas syringae]KWS42402.1 hypothetical protein AL060_16130 [Pseudomonas syringae pv. rhaphiolepidis]